MALVRSRVPAHPVAGLGRGQDRARWLRDSGARPAILALLEEQGFIFNFAGRKNLIKFDQLKMSQFNLAYLYSSVKTTALYSLEAFAGKLDYDKLRHHKTFGAYMASPSSIAACSVYSSSWDDESEEYLKWMVAAGAGRGNGEVPSAFPSTFFDITWACSSLRLLGCRNDLLP